MNQQSQHFLEKGSSNILIQIGVSLIIIAVVLAVFFFYPIIFLEGEYILLSGTTKSDVVLVDNRTNAQKMGQRPKIIPVDKEFGIVIPKIGANSKVVSNVDPTDPDIYQNALTMGVAHAKGTPLPGQIGNTFLFSHSSSNFYDATKYNAQFYLLNKLEKGDTFHLVYDYRILTYKVTSTEIVNPEDVKYLNSTSSMHTATLMTCWPPGTSLKRFLVHGQLVGSE